jgi:hypothetical protein
MISCEVKTKDSGLFIKSWIEILVSESGLRCMESGIEKFDA